MSDRSSSLLSAEDWVHLGNPTEVNVGLAPQQTRPSFGSVSNTTTQSSSPSTSSVHSPQSPQRYSSNSTLNRFPPSTSTTNATTTTTSTPPFLFQPPTPISELTQTSPTTINATDSFSTSALFQAVSKVLLRSKEKNPPDSFKSEILTLMFQLQKGAVQVSESDLSPSQSNPQLQLFQSQFKACYDKLKQSLSGINFKDFCFLSLVNTFYSKQGFSRKTGDKEDDISNYLNCLYQYSEENDRRLLGDSLLCTLDENGTQKTLQIEDEIRIKKIKGVKVNNNQSVFEDGEDFTVENKNWWDLLSISSDESSNPPPALHTIDEKRKGAGPQSKRWLLHIPPKLIGCYSNNAEENIRDILELFFDKPLDPFLASYYFLPFARCDIHPNCKSNLDIFRIGPDSILTSLHFVYLILFILQSK